MDTQPAFEDTQDVSQQQPDFNDTTDVNAQPAFEDTQPTQPAFEDTQEPSDKMGATKAFLTAANKPFVAVAKALPSVKPGGFIEQALQSTPETSMLLDFKRAAEQQTPEEMEN